jgi:hypothetical protein
MGSSVVRWVHGWGRGGAPPTTIVGGPFGQSRVGKVVSDGLAKGKVDGGGWIINCATRQRIASGHGWC